ncbi:MAG: extracellular solute-binding protein, partial [Lachnospiraceae bacterium]|nr:extracellular solute-binding protein [Lachnospiraceae bacterium]
MKSKKRMLSLFLAGVMPAGALLTGCGQGQSNSGKIEIELVHYKPEAVAVFEKLEEEFNRTHDNIHLTIESPNDAMTILKTRYIREDYPDIIGIGGDINYSYFIDSNILADVSDYPGLATIKPAYIDILEGLEFVPTEGTYGVPYVANAAGVLYNRAMFQEHGWEIPTTWDEFISLCEEIKAAGIQPLYFGFKDTWTCLAPWNALAVGLAPADVCRQVNQGETNFTEEYREIAEKMLELLQYGEDGPFAYGYNDACTAFANGESAMYTIGSYAVPQIKSVNPDMDIDSFTMPANDNADENILNSGVDLQFCVMSACENKEAAYEVLDFLLEHENVQAYLDDQNAVPCKDEEFELAPMLDGMKDFITEGRMADYQDHYYPSEMAVDAQIQTF